MTRAVTDALGRQVVTPSPAKRVVSLVPSETESVVELVGLDRLVGRTEFCVEPVGRIEAVPTVGGTKSVDVSAVLALEPDLVLANQEENARPAVERLIASGLAVHVSFPRTVAEAEAYLRDLAALLHVPETTPAIRAVADAIAEARVHAAARDPVRVFVPIWKDPWMTFDRRTFASDVLACCGADNVFSDRERRYPLAADLGAAQPAEDDGRDTRYPRVTLDEVVALEPELILLPDEPYEFSETELESFRTLDVPASHSGDVTFTDGKDLFWYGTRLAQALANLRQVIDRARANRPA